jgi:hypothetical protein
MANGEFGARKLEMLDADAGIVHFYALGVKLNMI